jgi:hypothetical protein
MCPIHRQPASASMPSGPGAKKRGAKTKKSETGQFLAAFFLSAALFSSCFQLSCDDSITIPKKQKPTVGFWAYLFVITCFIANSFPSTRCAAAKHKKVKESGKK